MILYSDGATKAQEDEANMILGVLTEIYPNHPWGVRVYGDEKGGGIFIHYLGFRGNAPWGINYKKGNHNYSASAMKRKVIMMAGEFLERASLVRGRNVNDDECGYVEGVPDRFQAPEFKAPVEFAQMAVAPSENRTEARPQALKQ